MVWSATSRILFSVAFPGDRPSPLFAFCGVLTNAVLIVATSEAWRQDGACAEQRAPSRVWLAIGAANQAAHAAFAVGITLAIRRRAQACAGTSCDLERVSLVSVVLHHAVVFAYAVFFVWILVWVSVAFARYPLSSCTSADVCCRFVNAYSSFNVFYAALVVLLFVFTLLTERGREPRWWQTALLSDLRRRELQALYEEQLGRTSARANLNADTDREMLVARQAQRVGAPVDNRRDARSIPSLRASQLSPTTVATAASFADEVTSLDSLAAQHPRPALPVPRLTSGLQRRPLPEDVQKSTLMYPVDAPPLPQPSARATRRNSRMVRFATEPEGDAFQSESHQNAFYDAPQRTRRPHQSSVAQMLERASATAPKPRSAVIVAKPSTLVSRGSGSVAEQFATPPVELEDVNVDVLQR